MTTDIVERLRGIALKDRVDAYSGAREACEEAADEIERLRGLTASDYIEAGYREAVADTIERCAQVAEKYGQAGYVALSTPHNIAAAIRALKEKP